MGNLCSSGCKKASDKKATAKKAKPTPTTTKTTASATKGDGAGTRAVTLSQGAAQAGAAAYPQSSLYGHAPILGYSTMGLGGTSMGASVAVGMGMGGW